MIKVSKSALVPYSAQELYDLVRDVEKYPLFLPWCTATQILHESGGVMKATMTVAKAGVSHSVTTLNRHQCPESITMELVEGPFDALSGRWQFTYLAQHAAKVAFDIEFQVKAKFIGMALSSVFNKAANNMVTSFEKRAVAIYGKR